MTSHPPRNQPPRDPGFGPVSSTTSPAFVVSPPGWLGGFAQAAARDSLQGPAGTELSRPAKTS